MRFFVETKGKRSGENQRAILYGQSAGAVSAIRPASEVVRTICDDAERLLRDRPRELFRS